MNSTSSKQAYQYEKTRTRDSLSTQILILALSVSIIPLVIFLTISLITNQNNTTQQLKNSLMSSAIVEKQYIESWLTQQFTTTQYLAELSGIKSLQPEQVAPVLEGAKAKIGIYDSLFLIAPDGMEIYDTDAGLGNPDALVNLGYRDYFKKAITGEALIADPVVSATSGKMIIIIAVPVKDDTNQVKAVLGVAFTLETIANNLKSLQTGNTGEAIFQIRMECS
jgi:methyl-accepting chemotaxis protein